MKIPALQKQWLRYAVNRSAMPDRLVLLSLVLGLIALVDFVSAFFAGHLGLKNYIFCAFAVGSLALGAVMYWKDQVELFDRAEHKISNIILSKFAPPKPIILPEDYQKNGYVVATLDHGFGFWSPDVSKHLFQGAANGKLSDNIKIVSGFFSGKEELRRGAGVQQAITALRAQKIFTNDRKLRLRSDILLDLGSGGHIEIQPTDYLASRCSNDLAFRRVETRVAGLEDKGEARIELQYDGVSFFLRESGGAFLFRGFVDSDCSNQIGVSTIAFSSDGYLLLVSQLVGGVESANLIAPSGSGSLDWSDLPVDVEGVNFWDWIARASARELREELGLTDAALHSVDGCSQADRAKQMAALTISSMPIGFGGFLHRGGKPDFFFLAKLSCTLDDIRLYSAYSKQERFLSKRCEASHARKVKSFAAAEIMTVIENSSTKDDSFPLGLGYLMLREVCTAYPNEIEKFLTD